MCLIHCLPSRATVHRSGSGSFFGAHSRVLYWTSPPKNVLAPLSLCRKCVCPVNGDPSRCRFALLFVMCVLGMSAVPVHARTEHLDTPIGVQGTLSFQLHSNHTWNLPLA